MSSRSDALLWLWIGAAVIVAAVVAPALFAVLPSRALAGQVVGRILPVVFWSGALVGVVHLATGHGWRRAAAAVIILAALGAQLGVNPRIARLRAALGPNIEAIPADDPQRMAFGRLHGVSVALLGVGLLAAAAIAIAGLVSPSPREATTSGAAAAPPAARAG